MELINNLIEFILHVDRHLHDLVSAYGAWVYGILFVVVFAETGFVVTPFLPGDSLLFAAGAVAATKALNPHMVSLILIIAAILGDTVNYAAGFYFGPKVFSKPKSLLFNPDHLERTRQFYEKYGGKTIIIARFIPIIRTFAPFVAGIGKMSYWRFISYNVIGGIAWVLLFVYSGFFFGNLPMVKQNFGLIIVVIIVISVAPMFIELITHWKKKGPVTEHSPYSSQNKN